MIHQFSEAEKTQAWFERLRDSLDKRLQKLREQNDVLRDAEETAYLRGQIAEIKHLLGDMGKKPIQLQAVRRNPYQ